MVHEAPGGYARPPDPGPGAGGARAYLNVVYAAVQGYRPLRLDLRTPPGDGPWPVVVEIHGGAWWENNRLLTPQAPERADFRDRLLRRGYALAEIEYRLSREAVFPAQLHDVKAAIRWLRAFATWLRLDPGRFAAWGDSAGGHLAALAGLTGQGTDRDLEGGIGVPDVSSAVHAVVDWYGVAALVDDRGEPAIPAAGAEDPGAWLLGGPVRRHRAAAVRAGPVSHVHGAAPPFLCVHGTADDIVPFAQSELLTAALLGAGVRCDLHPVPGGGHGFGPVETPALIDLCLDFLDQVLRP